MEWRCSNAVRHQRRRSWLVVFAPICFAFAFAGCDNGDGQTDAATGGKPHVPTLPGIDTDASARTSRSSDEPTRKPALAQRFGAAPSASATVVPASDILLPPVMHTAD